MQPARTLIISAFSKMYQVTEGLRTLSGATEASSASDYKYQGIGPLREDIRKDLTSMRTELGNHFSERDCYLMLFPIVVYFDEIIQVLHPGANKETWVPLQREFFQTDQGGELFFDTVDELLDQELPSLIYEVYFFCMSMGFSGRFAGNTQKLQAYMSRIKAKFKAPIVFSLIASLQAPKGLLNTNDSKILYYVLAASAVIGTYLILVFFG